MRFVIFLAVAAIIGFIVYKVLEAKKQKEQLAATQAQIKALVAEGGSPDQVKIGVFDSNHQLAKSGQYDLVKHLVFHLVEKGYEIHSTSVSKNSTYQQYEGLIYFSQKDIQGIQGSIRFTKSAKIVDELWYSWDYSYTVERDREIVDADERRTWEIMQGAKHTKWEIVDGDGIRITEKYDRKAPEPSEFLLLCADVYESSGYKFSDPVWYKEIAKYSYIPLVKMHEYIKTGSKSW